MCTLPEMRCSESFVLVGIVRNSPSALTQLVHRAALLYLLGNALPYNMPAHQQLTWAQTEPSVLKLFAGSITY